MAYVSSKNSFWTHVYVWALIWHQGWNVFSVEGVAKTSLLFCVIYDYYGQDYTMAKLSWKNTVLERMFGNDFKIGAKMGFLSAWRECAKIDYDLYWVCLFFNNWNSEKQFWLWVQHRCKLQCVQFTIFLPTFRCGLIFFWKRQRKQSWRFWAAFARFCALLNLICGSEAKLSVTDTAGLPAWFSSFVDAWWSCSWPPKKRLPAIWILCGEEMSSMCIFFLILLIAMEL